MTNTAVPDAPSQASQEHAARSAQAERAATKELTANDPLKAYTVEIGERSYVVHRLVLARMVDLSTLIVEEFELVARLGLLDRRSYSDIIEEEAEEPNEDGTPRIVKRRVFSPSKLARIVSQVWEKAPDFLGRLMALVLDASEADDQQYILENTDPWVALDVVDAFLDRNNVEDVVERFFRAKRRIQRIVDAIRAEDEERQLARAQAQHTQSSTPPPSLPEQDTEPVQLRP